MKFKIKKVMLYGNKELNIYIPIKVPKQLTAVDPIVWDNAILGNSIAYEFLKKLFVLAANLDSKEIIYIPTHSMKINEYKDGIFDMDIVLLNYHATQLKAKEIFKAVKTKSIFTEYIREVIIEDNNIVYPDYWLTDRKLSARRFKNTLIISTNRDVFLMLAYDAGRMTGIEDNEEYNFDSHIHEDSIGTSENNGFNFLYYHKKDNI